MQRPFTNRRAEAAAAKLPGRPTTEFHFSGCTRNRPSPDVAQDGGGSWSRPWLLLLAGVVMVCTSNPVSAQVALARAKNCLACHGVEKKILGPAFTDVAAKYAGQPDAVERLATKVRQGGAGVWGPVPMPPNDRVDAAEARQLVGWVLSLNRKAR